jgi:hypothetical protein
MVPLLFIIIVATALSLLIYWVLSSMQETERVYRKIPRFNYELASELSTYGESDLYVPQNSIKLSGDDVKNLLAYWNLSQARLEQVARHNQTTADPEQIVLRLYEVSEWQHYHDIKVKSLSGRCRFELQPGSSYYLELGISIQNHFVPILTSNTIKKTQLAPSL